MSELAKSDLWQDCCEGGFLGQAWVASAQRQSKKSNQTSHAIGLSSGLPTVKRAGRWHLESGGAVVLNCGLENCLLQLYWQIPDHFNSNRLGDWFRQLAFKSSAQKVAGPLHGRHSGWLQLKDGGLTPIFIFFHSWQISCSFGSHQAFWRSIHNTLQYVVVVLSTRLPNPGGVHQHLPATYWGGQISKQCGCQVLGEAEWKQFSGQRSGFDL